jgi:death-on-curing protein
MSEEPKWASYDQVAAIHSRQLRRFGGAPGLRDDGVLRSALERPINKWQYEEPLAKLSGAACGRHL